MDSWLGIMQLGGDAICWTAIVLITNAGNGANLLGKMSKIFDESKKWAIVSQNAASVANSAGKLAKLTHLFAKINNCVESKQAYF